MGFKAGGSGPWTLSNGEVGRGLLSSVTPRKMTEGSTQSCYHLGLKVSRWSWEQAFSLQKETNGDKNISTMASASWFGVWKRMLRLEFLISFGNSQHWPLVLPQQAGPWGRQSRGRERKKFPSRGNRIYGEWAGRGANEESTSQETKAGGGNAAQLTQGYGFAGGQTWDQIPAP